MDTGTVFGKYHIRGLLGRGGMGVVYLAEDTILTRLVALKVLDRLVTTAPQFEKRFLQEARTVAGLNHPNIVPIHALSQIEEEWAIEMPYIEGGSLMEAEEKGALNLRQTLGCVRDVLLALAACHESGIIHRDVKPSNILLGDGQRGLLSDFGLAKILSDHQQLSVQSRCSASMFIGTPRYAPPESWEERTPTKTWDIYSTGMVLYEAIAGDTPFDAQTPLSLMKQMLERPIPPLKEAAPAVSDALSGLVSEMLAMNPVDRPQDVADVLEAFWALPELSGDSASPPVLVKPRPRRRAAAPIVRRMAATLAAPRRGFLLSALAGLIMLVLSGVGFHFFLQRSETIPVSPVSGDNAGHAAFDVMDMESQELRVGHCMALFSPDALGWRLLAVDTARLWLLDMTPEPDNRVRVSGYWTDYDRVSAMRFRQGAVAGKGRWVRPGEDMSVTLRLETLDDDLVGERSVLFKRANTPDGAARFLDTFSAADAVPALVFNELLPRDVSWAPTLEAALRELGLVYLAAPYRASGTAPVLLDGQLTEPAWRVSLAKDPRADAQVAPTDGPADAFLSAFRDDEALYLGIHLPSPLGPSRLLLALQTMHGTAQSHAPRWAFQVDHGAVVSSRAIRGGVAVPWDSDWGVAEHEATDAHAFEIRIPFAGLEMAAAPLGSQRWLLNCQAGRTRPGGMDDVARWGHEDLERTSRGLVLLFLD